MDFTKFVFLLDNSSLYFSRADQLGDPFEGSYSRGNVSLRPLVYKEAPNAAAMFEQVARLSKWVREWTFISCWHMNEHESAAMWRLYAKSNEAVAVTSTYARLVEVLPRNVFIGAVQYIDYERDWLPEGNSFYPFMHKRKSFEHEREVRAIIQELPSENGSIPVGKQNLSLGQVVQIKPGDLIERVHVAPTASPWLRDLVERISRKYEQTWAVHRSLLDSEPVY
jgi:hypothetical protein